MLPLAYQGMTFNVKTIKKPADPTYKDLPTLEFNSILPEGRPFGPHLSTFVNISQYGCSIHSFFLTFPNFYLGSVWQYFQSF